MRRSSLLTLPTKAAIAHSRHMHMISFPLGMELWLLSPQLSSTPHCLLADARTQRLK
ncbi:hypothetical protein M407DRAFT_34730 [Tulasnella calospora MUT 4182]|uniref:Uncharacterized protein n=1 Tax=Tulasnella calospora MUT 4182 TaxID=1051891 RepID=A0A0C3PMT4_9AGAM|nr:hypothetical protein M407DRAFT_34730 [Tulasnella calospora MUT 4182]